MAPPPAALNDRNPLTWLRANLFNGVGNSVTTIILLAGLAYIVPSFLNWAVFEAIYRPDAAACRAAEGACWGMIGEKYRVMLFGRYPFDEQWRPVAATVVLIAMIAWSINPQRWGRWLLAAWLIAIPAILVLMGGEMSYVFIPLLVAAPLVLAGLATPTIALVFAAVTTLLVAPTLLGWLLAVAGGSGAPVFNYPTLPPIFTSVDTSLWGGLPLTLILATVGIVCSFPLAIALALGRQSELPAIKALCIGFIELIRGVPLITILFMASLMIPLFLPEGVNTDKLIRAQIGFILFAAAYVAEVIRGGLAAIPKGQYEAADALGLPYWYKTGFIILPQALKLVIMPMMNTFIGLFKDTSLVSIISMFDLLGAVGIGMADPEWRAFHVEGLVFVAVIYFLFCYAMARYAENLEDQLNTNQR